MAECSHLFCEFVTDIQECCIYCFVGYEDFVFNCEKRLRFAKIYANMIIVFLCIVTKDQRKVRPDFAIYADLA